MKRKLVAYFLVLALFIHPCWASPIGVDFSGPVNFGNGDSFFFFGSADVEPIPMDATTGTKGTIDGSVDWTPKTTVLPCAIPCGILAFIATLTLVLAPKHHKGNLNWTFDDGSTANRSYEYNLDPITNRVIATGTATMSFNPGYARDIVSAKDFILTISSTAPGLGLETGKIIFEKSDGSFLTAVLNAPIEFDDPLLVLSNPRRGLIKYDINVYTGKFFETVTYVPEPNTFLLLVFGLVFTGLFGFGWQRKTA